jgi:selenocysteine-specific elongation factor
VALTKCDVVEDELRELAAEETRELLTGTFLEGAPLVETSSVTGGGLEEFKEALDDLVTDFRDGARRQPVRVPIDRIFVMPGFGTVITGTLLGGSLGESDRVAILPAGTVTRVRAIQIHGGSADRVSAPTRVALNLVGVEADTALRGQWVVEPGSFEPATSILARISSMPWVHKPLRLPTRMSLSHGSGSFACEIHGQGHVGEQPPLLPGHTSVVRIQTAEPVVARAGDRIILRRGGGMGGRRLSRLLPRNGAGEAPGPADTGKGFSTLAGGTVIDPCFGARRIGESLVRQVEELDDTAEAWIAFALRGSAAAGLGTGELTQRVPSPPAASQKALEGMLRTRAAVKVGRETIVGIHAYERMLARAREALSRFHAEQPERAGIKRDALRDLVVGPAAAPLFDALLKRLVNEGSWEIDGDLVSEPGHSPVSASLVSQLAETILVRLDRSPAAPPGLRDLASELGVETAELRRAVDLLLSSGRARLLDGDFLYAAAFLESLEGNVRTFLTRNDKLLVTDLKAIVGVTRKHALPLARWLDNSGVTIRRGDFRVLKK